MWEKINKQTKLFGGLGGFSVFEENTSETLPGLFFFFFFKEDLSFSDQEDNNTNTIVNILYLFKSCFSVSSAIFLPRAGIKGIVITLANSRLLKFHLIFPQKWLNILLFLELFL